MVPKPNSNSKAMFLVVLLLLLADLQKLFQNLGCPTSLKVLPLRVAVVDFGLPALLPLNTELSTYHHLLRGLSL